LPQLVHNRRIITGGPAVSWWVYMVRCADNSLYTGITTDLDRRLREHNEGKSGSRYTRARRPVTLAYQEASDSRAHASRREHEIKQLSPSAKQALIDDTV